MQKFKTKITWVMASLVTISGLMAACTKSVPYKSVYKGENEDKVQEKSLIDENAEYLFVASSDLANNDSTGAANALPYWQGQEKIVKFRFTENTLQVVQVNEEARLQDNKTNEKLVLEIPIQTVDYQCTQDRYGKCTNQEEENHEISWQKKSKFLPKFDTMKSTGFSMLPVEMEKVFGGSCFNETSSQFLGYELTKDALNVQIQKTFVADMKCIDEKGIMATSMDDMQAQIIYHYSFVKLNSVANPNYKAIQYPADTDEDAFGFFTTENRKYDVDYNHTWTSKAANVMLNRWSPDKKELTYYLTDNFNKPEMKAVKDATYKAFDRVNAGLKAAGIDTRLVLKEPAHKAPGDIRNSMIVLVEDPVAAGPLGYGPTVANPRTGEILSGRVAMYYGNYLQNISYTYDQVVRDLIAEKSAARMQNKDAKTAIKAGADVPLGAPATASAAKVSASLQNQMANHLNISKMQSRAIGQKMATQYNSLKNTMVAAKSVKASGFVQNTKYTAASLKNMTSKQFEKLTMQVNKTSSATDTLSAMSKYCNYPAELFPFNEIIRSALQAKLGEDLKPWAKLTADDKKAVMDIILPEVWLPTLVHELGHNLGLRHNFGGSQDKDNFYSKDELNAMGVAHAIPYSSVMDYGYSDLNLLPTLGKYDIAALRYAYKREVETTDGKVLTVATTLRDLKKDLDAKNDGTELKSYKYCSDEHVDVNPDCKRFDEGTTYSEIAANLIKSYNELYTLRNFRNNREVFSKLSDAAYMGRIMTSFQYMRGFMERYESVKYRFDLADDAPDWENDAFLKDLKNAALMTGKFFVSVLQTPDATCALASKNDPTTITTITRLDNIDKEALSCFDIPLKPEYVMVGQAGRLFNDRKDPNSDNHYADQIDVRGYWMDKLAAAKVLLARQVDNSIYDEHEDNYMDIAEMTDLVATAIGSMLMNQVDAPVTFKNAVGVDVIAGTMPVDVFSTPDDLTKGAPSHWVDTPLEASVAEKLGIPMQQTSFQQLLLDVVSKSMAKSQSHISQSLSTINSLSVTKTSTAYQLDSNSGAIMKDMSGIRYLAMPENDIARVVMTASNAIEAMDKLTDDQLKELVAEKTATAQKAAAAAAAANKATAKKPVAPTSKFGPQYAIIPLQIVQAYASGALQPASAYNYLLQLMPASNY